MSAIGVSGSRRIRPAPVTTAIAMAGLTISSASTIETRPVARRCARGATGQKASNRSGQRTIEGRTADDLDQEEDHWHRDIEEDRRA
jgi:hypothetical protein